MHEYRVDPDQRIVQERFRGRLLLEDLIAGMSAVADDPACPLAYDIIVDLLDAELAVHHSEMLALLDVHDGRYDVAEENGRTALIADDPRTTALAMLFVNKVATREAKVFSNHDDARRWLARHREP